MTAEAERVDLAGVGIGPFNLSLAALASEIPDLGSAFFERRTAFAWHPGLAFADAVMQTSFLKDLVTPVMPTSRWSFLNYLVTHGRFFDFLAGRFEAVPRLEFTAYMAWVADLLPSTRFGRGVEAVEHDGAGFVLHLADGAIQRSRALAVGAGAVPDVPAGAPLGPDCLHAGRYLECRPVTAGRRVALVGGGQSGAEILLDLLSGDPGPREIVWLSRRDGFWSLQEGGLVDQFFTPAYQAAYRAMPPRAQAAALASQKYASDGLTPQTSAAIYGALYRRRHLQGRNDVSLRPARTVVGIERRGGAFRLTARTGAGVTETVEADVVLLATGYRPAVPRCLAPLASRLELEADGALALGDAYRVIWDGPGATPIYGLNHGRRSYGVIDPQLSLAAWRSAVILNDLTGRHVFDLSACAGDAIVNWSPDSATGVTAAQCEAFG